MAKIKVEEKLDQLAGFIQAHKGSVKEMEDIVDQALRTCPDLKRQYEELQTGLTFISEKEAELTSQIREVVIKAGGSVKGRFLQAVYNKGRTTWDTKALEGYAVAHPEIEKLKKIGEPSVSIREIKEREGNRDDRESA